MSKTFPQESSETFFNLKSLHYAEQKDFTSVFQQSALKGTSKKNMSLLASQNRNFLTLSHLF